MNDPKTSDPVGSIVTGIDETGAVSSIHIGYMGTIFRNGIPVAHMDWKGRTGDKEIDQRDADAAERLKWFTYGMPQVVASSFEILVQDRDQWRERALRLERQSKPERSLFDPPSPAATRQELRADLAELEARRNELEGAGRGVAMGERAAIFQIASALHDLDQRLQKEQRSK
jgi:hypothetical protein